MHDLDSAPEPESGDVHVTFKVLGLEHELHVIRAEGEEGLSRLFEFRLVLASTSNQIDFSAVLDKPCTLHIARKGRCRYINGLVSSFQQRKRERKVTIYHLSMVPKVWRLLHRKDCRIFQKMTTEEIVRKVLDETQLSREDYKIKLEQSTSKRRWEYCVQYRESDWGFISRLLEEHGFFYFFTHEAESHTLVIANNYQVHPPVAGEPEVLFHEPTANLPTREFISSFSLGEMVCPGKVTLDDFNPLKPALSLRSQVRNGPDPALEIYDYPGEYTDPETGGSLASIRLQELQALHRQGEGESDCMGFVPGHWFVLVGHTRDDFNGEKLLLTSVSHFCEKHEDIEGGALEKRARYRNSFCCIPRAVPFRATQRTPKPTPLGVQTAVVVGPPGEEIYTDEHGRVKVQFFWDRQGRLDENSSCWLRVSQTWASRGWGALFLPRIGDEVIVDFIEGDPDRPIIIGGVYNARNVPPHVLPEHKTQSTIKSSSSPGGDGFNEVRFEDMKGSEELFTHAQKDQRAVVRNNYSGSVGNDFSESVGHDYSESIANMKTIKVGVDHTEAIGKKMHISIGVALIEEVGGVCSQTVGGAKTLQVGGAMSQTVGATMNETVVGGRSTSIGQDYTEQVQGTHTESVGGDKVLEASSVLIKAREQLVLSVGQARIVISKDGRIAIEGTDLHARGSSLGIKTSGTIKMKGSKIDKN